MSRFIGMIVETEAKAKAEEPKEEAKPKKKASDKKDKK